MNKLDLLKLAEKQDVEAYNIEDFEVEEKKPVKKFEEDYSSFYNDVKQNSKYIKEDW